MRPRATQPLLAPLWARACRRPLSTAPRLPNGPLLVLGLESSADDTCAAVVSSDRRLLSNVVLKQSAIHESFGGIHPLHAQEAHQRNMPLAISRALSEAGVTLDELDGIAATRGPGMYGCLSVCLGAGKALAAATGKPLIGVHHMQAHALTPFLTAYPLSPSSQAPQFPFLTLLLSGGHTLLLLASSRSEFRILATTADESIGAALDKAARDLGVDWALGAGSPGAALEKFAHPDAPGAGEEVPLLLPAAPVFPLPFPRELSFSYAGLRSALTRLLRSEPPAAMHPARKGQVARAFMDAAFEQVAARVELGMRRLEEEEGAGAGGEEGATVRGLVVSGGVASNLVLRERLRSRLDKLGKPDLPLIFPPPHLCTDNAAMIAWVGLDRLERGLVDPLTVMQRAKWSIDECEADFANKDKDTSSRLVA